MQGGERDAVGDGETLLGLKEMKSFLSTTVVHLLRGLSHVELRQLGGTLGRDC